MHAAKQEQEQDEDAFHTPGSCHHAAAAGKGASGLPGDVTP
jgi:hypothetical protein